MQPATLHRRAALTAAVFTALFLVLLALVATHWGPLGSTDRDIVVALHRSAVEHRGWTKANRVLTDWVWDPWTMRALLAVAVGWLLWRREWLLALWVAVTAAAGTALQQAIKAGVDRARPQWPDPVDSAHYAAFPSGHALTTTVTFGLLLWLLTLHGAPAKWLRLMAVVAAVSVLGVGFTRLYLGVHWPSDVLAGWLLGAALVYAAIASYGCVRSRTSERRASPEGKVRS
ncbi:phosphatase PAP2 family protein [Streptomyces malaysiensis subsp. malaysiensis]|uniref:Phosphatase PAP2 family protein n=1 Tax=Streptomyces malaysiensis TaxID=92644 RepID=A0ABX6W087_STRMQ|nr:MULTISPECIES: phosphatase PAP2 family protein [Streptomyces]QPI54819.1 phosphatase PAP2 family protein [Streptomyces solisilvae]UHH16219.1 phosphatase PAP2 family protein [Streptomyces sp. HNM0561]